MRERSRLSATFRRSACPPSDVSTAAPTADSRRLPAPGRFVYPFSVSQRPSANVPWPVMKVRLHSGWRQWRRGMALTGAGSAYITGRVCVCDAGAEHRGQRLPADCVLSERGVRQSSRDGVILARRSFESSPIPQCSHGTCSMNAGERHMEYSERDGYQDKRPNDAVEYIFHS